MLRVMTPLLGTKNPSAPVGDAPEGDNKAAQAVAFQVFTNHETRDTALAWRAAQAGANIRGFHETRDTRHESRLLSPPGRCFPARCGAIWGGYGAAWAAWGAPSRCPRTVGASNRAFQVFTKHETRVCLARRAGCPLGRREFRGFHETRDTRHESRLLSPPGRCFPARCGAAWGGYGAAWAAWGAPSRCPRTVRTGNRAFRVFTRHETRDTNHGLYGVAMERLWRVWGGYGDGAAWAAVERHGRHIAPAPVSPLPSAFLGRPYDWPACLTTWRGEVRERAVRHFFWSD